MPVVEHRLIEESQIIVKPPTTIVVFSGAVPKNGIYVSVTMTANRYERLFGNILVSGGDGTLFIEQSINNLLWSPAIQIYAPPGVPRTYGVSVSKYMRLRYLNGNSDTEVYLDGTLYKGGWYA